MQDGGGEEEEEEGGKKRRKGGGRRGGKGGEGKGGQARAPFYLFYKYFLNYQSFLISTFCAWLAEGPGQREQREEKGGERESHECHERGGHTHTGTHGDGSGRARRGRVGSSG